MLIAGFALFWLSRTRAWWGRTAMVLPAAVGLLAALGTVITLLVAGQLANRAVSVLLMLVWVVAAGYATVQGLRTTSAGAGRRPAGPGSSCWLSYAIIGPAPTAVGRWLFAPELRDAAAVPAGRTRSRCGSRRSGPPAPGCSTCAACWSASPSGWPTSGGRRGASGFAALSLALVGAGDRHRAVGLADLDHRAPSG